MYLDDRLKRMKEQFAILPHLPIVGTLKLTSHDGKTLSSITVVKKQKATERNSMFEHCFKEIQNYLNGSSHELDIELDLSHLTKFQTKVMDEMKKIPYGGVASYKDLAVSMNSKGYQAIGTACGKNPFLLIYPCHRVVGSNDLGGFAHGIAMKKKLLDLESTFH